MEHRLLYFCSSVYGESTNENVDYLLCNDQATLFYMVNLACIEINPWNSTIKNIDNPDWIVIDLDPDDIDFKEVVKTAHLVKEVLDEMNIECCCKTSGETGLHIYVPIASKYDYNSAKIFAELIAHTVNVRLPKTTSILRSPQKRRNSVYIDFLQNAIGQTLAAPYSVRPKPGVAVSTPLKWSEVDQNLSPSQFTIKNILNRIEKKGDLWKAIFGKGADLETIIKNISNDPDKP